MECPCYNNLDRLNGRQSNGKPMLRFVDGLNNIYIYTFVVYPFNPE